jgi:hypothetical protein
VADRAYGPWYAARVQPAPMKVFLAFAFRPEDKAFVALLDQLLASHRAQPTTGEALGGEQLTPAVQERIDKCEALIGLATRRDQKVAGGYTTHQWVLDELAYARNKGKRAIAIVEDGVDLGGMFAPHEHIPLDRAQPVSAILRVSETIGLWTMERGRTLKIQLLPEALAEAIGAGANGLQCSYRLWLQAKPSDWIDAVPVPEGGGAFVWVQGVLDEHLIQLRVQNKGKVWLSPATSQWMPIALKVGEGA